METESDPNVMYGGDIEDFGEFVSLGDMMLSNLRAAGDKLALVNALTNQTWTFRQILDESIAMARTLRGAGLKQGDVVVMLSENREEFVTIAFGAMFLNAIVGPVNVTYTGRELNHVFGLSKPKMVVVSAFAEKKILEASRELDFIEKVILLDGETIDDRAVSLKDLIKKHESVEFNIDDQVSKPIDMTDQVAVIMCSSGTTGLPKGVQTTQANLKNVIDGYRKYFGAFQVTLNLSEFKILNIAPFFHGLGFIWMCVIVFIGGPISVFLPRFEEESFLRSIETYKIDMITVVPTIAVKLSKSPLIEKFDLSSVQEVFSSGAILSKEVEEKLQARLKHKVNFRQGYGLTETTFGLISTGNILKRGSVGEVVQSVYVKVIDENGKSLGPNENGELCFKSPRIMKGYIDNPQATAELFDKDGWLHSGDIGYYDDDKQFFVIDRIKDLIKYNAFQVPPVEIESLLLTHDKIRDVAVVGVPDEEAGELPFAFVVKQTGVELTEKEVCDFVAANASKAKWLRGGVKFMDELPRNSNGKVLKRQLRQGLVDA